MPSKRLVSNPRMPGARACRRGGQPPRAPPAARPKVRPLRRAAPNSVTTASTECRGRDTAAPGRSRGTMRGWPPGERAVSASTRTPPGDAYAASTKSALPPPPPRTTRGPTPSAFAWPVRSISMAELIETNRGIVARRAGCSSPSAGYMPIAGLSWLKSSRVRVPMSSTAANPGAGTTASRATAPLCKSATIASLPMPTRRIRPRSASARAAVTASGMAPKPSWIGILRNRQVV